jgi:predicted metal-dependent enzyme (double-stranded beta helix superfamily)
MEHASLESLFIQDLIALKHDAVSIFRRFEQQGLTPMVLNKLSQLTSTNVPTVASFAASNEAHASMPQPYSRSVIHTGPDCEIMVARWTPQISCAPHDHGVSRGWVFYLEGHFLETSFQLNAGRTSQCLQPFATQKHLAGEYTFVKNDEIHSCVSPDGGLSLHVYFPRIEQMQVYDIRGERTFTVSSDCGAWIPKPHQSIEERKWNSLSAIVAS